METWGQLRSLRVLNTEAWHRLKSNFHSYFVKPFVTMFSSAKREEPGNTYENLKSFACQMPFFIMHQLVELMVLMSAAVNRFLTALNGFAY